MAGDGNRMKPGGHKKTNNNNKEKAQKGKRKK